MKWLLAALFVLSITAMSSAEYPGSRFIHPRYAGPPGYFSPHGIYHTVEVERRQRDYFRRNPQKFNPYAVATEERRRLGPPEVIFVPAATKQSGPWQTSSRMHYQSSQLMLRGFHFGP